jgi:hypothetical protein
VLYDVEFSIIRQVPKSTYANLFLNEATLLDGEVDGVSYSARIEFVVDAKVEFAETVLSNDTLDAEGDAGGIGTGRKRGEP